MKTTGLKFPGQKCLVNDVYRALLPMLLLAMLLSASCKKEPAPAGKLEITDCYSGSIHLSVAAETSDVSVSDDIVIKLSKAVDLATVGSAVQLKDADNIALQDVYFEYADNNATIIVKHTIKLIRNQKYTLSVNSKLKGAGGETFSGVSYRFVTANPLLSLKKITFNGREYSQTTKLNNVPVDSCRFALEFSEALDTVSLRTKFNLSGSNDFTILTSSDRKNVSLKYNRRLAGYTRYSFAVSTGLRSVDGNYFGGFSNTFSTAVDSSLKFPLISDDELLTLVQRQTFRYFYDFAHPNSGLARERNSSGDIVTTGGSGFGVMALIVGMERGFISRSEGITRLQKIVSFLETCDRFHGAWPHWINGSTGKVVPFGEKDNGGDLVETAFMVQGLLAVRQYLKTTMPDENALRSRITGLYNSVEWDWYTRGGQNVLYWHWSPNYAWDMNFQLQGYNETLITYILAASSPTHTIPAAAYHLGYARSGAIRNGKTFYGYALPVGYDYGGPLFFAHYSFLGLDPRNLSDAYANYWTQNVNHSLINWAYCKANPKGWPNYSGHCWGLTASDVPGGYQANEPSRDIGVITPTAAVSSLPYTPEQSMSAIRFFYYILGDKLWGNYGFYDAFDVQSNWWADSYLAIDQGPEVVMIENYRTHLLWNLFMSAPEVQSGLTKLGFTYK